MAQRYGQLKQTLDPLPGARLTAAETAASQGEGVAIAEGRAGQAKGQALEQLGGTAAAIGTKLYTDRLEANARARKKAQEDADDLAVMNAKNQLDNWRINRLYTPQTGALAQQGPNSFGLPEQVSQEFDTVSSQIEAGLNDRQRGKFAQHKSDVALETHAQLLRHVAGEMTTYENDELSKRIQNGTDLAIVNAGDPRAVGVALNGVIDDIVSTAKRRGLGPEQTIAQVRAVQTDVHKGVIERLLAEGQSKNAQIYFEETKGQISATAQTQLEKALAVGHARTEAQKASDKIIAEGGTVTEQIAKAKDQLEGDARDEAITYIKQNRDETEKQNRADDEARLTKAYNVVDRQHTVSAIPPAEWVAMSGSSRSALRGYAEHLAKGIPVETDLPTYYSLMTQAGTDPTSFLKANLLDYRDKVGETEFKQLTELQLAIRKGDRAKADDALAGFRTHKEIVDNALTSYGLDPNAKPDTPQGIANAALLQMLDRRVEAAQQPDKNGVRKKISNVEITQTLDSILSQGRETKGSWWGLIPGNGVALFDSTKRLIDLTPADVPSVERTKITAALRRAGRPVTDQTILDTYREAQVK